MNEVIYTHIVDMIAKRCTPLLYDAHMIIIVVKVQIISTAIPVLRFSQLILNDTNGE